MLWVFWFFINVLPIYNKRLNLDTHFTLSKYQEAGLTWARYGQPFQTFGTFQERDMKSVHLLPEKKNIIFLVAFSTFNKV